MGSVLAARAPARGMPWSSCVCSCPGPRRPQTLQGSFSLATSFPSGNSVPLGRFLEKGRPQGFQLGKTEGESAQDEKSPKKTGSWGKARPISEAAGGEDRNALCKGAGGRAASERSPGGGSCHCSPPTPMLSVVGCLFQDTGVICARSPSCPGSLMLAGPIKVHGCVI